MEPCEQDLWIIDYSGKRPYKETRIHPGHHLYDSAKRALSDNLGQLGDERCVLTDKEQKTRCSILEVT